MGIAQVVENQARVLDDRDTGSGRSPRNIHSCDGGRRPAGWRQSLSGSMIGGIQETQEMLDFCGQHDITSDVEVIPIQKVNEAYERLVKGDVKYRFAIEMASLKSE
jgi:hypothetical protein